jgi:hypothetical protein
MAARFLNVSPDTPVYRSILDRRVVDDESALARLKRISGEGGEVDTPRILTLSDEALQLLDAFCADLHADTQNYEGLEAGFLGKGRDTVVRLAAVLALLRRSEMADAEQLTTITADDIKDPAGLWRTTSGSMLKPRSLVPAGPEDRLTRKVAHWLITIGLDEISRETVRRDALGQAVDAAGADAIIARLVEERASRPSPLGRSGPEKWCNWRSEAVSERAFQ